MLSKMRLSASFSPAFGLGNKHIQTVFSSVGPRRFLVRKRYAKFTLLEQNQIIECDDNIRLAGVYTQSPKTFQEGGNQSKKLAILIHGWEGSVDSSYMLSMSASLLEQGIDVFRLNLRDHGNTHHLNRGLFNSTLVDEVISAVSNIQQRYPHQQNYLIGFSLGGNFSLRVAALAKKTQVTLDAVIAFCPVIHAKHSNYVLNNECETLYGNYFVKKWKNSLRIKLAHFPEYDYAAELEKAKTLDDLNDSFIPKYTPYEKLDEYFEAYAISGDKLNAMDVPCYLHFSKDDMIIPHQDIKQIADSPNIDITLTEKGGHCGYIMNWKLESWQDKRAIELINAS